MAPHVEMAARILVICIAIVGVLLLIPPEPPRWKPPLKKRDDK